MHGKGKKEKGKENSIRKGDEERERKEGNTLVGKGNKKEKKKKLGKLDGRAVLKRLREAQAGSRVHI